MRRLIAQIVPEIADGRVMIRAVARDRARLTKVVLQSSDPALDPIEVVVGEDGARARRLVAALGGEHVDFIPWDESPTNLACNAVSPIEVRRVILGDADQHPPAMALVVDDDDLAVLVSDHLALAAQVVGFELLAMPLSRYERSGGDDWTRIPSARPDTSR